MELNETIRKCDKIAPSPLVTETEGGKSLSTFLRVGINSFS
jgi:hypothetical protein